MNSVLMSQGSKLGSMVDPTQAIISASLMTQLTSSTSAIHQPLLSDSQLLTLCQKYGSQAKLWKQKFLGLLPEVNKRKLYTQKGCSSLFEFAAKLGGVSREQVLLVLRLSKSFESTPDIKQALVSGSVPLSKLSRIASVVNESNQEFWLNQSKLLSKGAWETLVKDSKAVPGHVLNPNKTEKVTQFDELKLSAQTRERLLALQNKGFDVDQMVNDLLNQREQQIQQEKEGIRDSLKQGEVRPSRYIPVKIRQVLAKEFGSKCAYEKCSNRSMIIHHSKRFSIDPSHNPIFLAPLCKPHHEIAHSVDVRVQTFKKV